MKGVRLGVLGERYYQYGRRAFDGICETCLSEHDGRLALDNICLVAGLGNTAHREGTFDYYMSEPVVKMMQRVWRRWCLPISRPCITTSWPVSAIRSPPRACAPSRTRLADTLRASTLIRDVNNVGAITPGVRLHDLPQGTVEERIRMAGELGFSCIQLPSKVLYASMGIDRGGLTRELADHLRAVLDEAGVSVAVLGCYKNLATPDRQQLMDNFAEYEACLNFVQMLGGCPVGTETGRPNAQNRVADDRMTDEALEAFMDGLARVCERAEAVGGQILIEPGWNETVNTPDRCREVLERVSSPSLGVIYDPVSLLHPSVVDEAQEITARMLYLCGSKIRVLHAKDYEVVDNEDEAGWCDGTGSRLVCHGVGETGRYDFEPVVAWAAAACPGIPCVVENSVPATAADCLATLEHMSTRCGASHREL